MRPLCPGVYAREPRRQRLGPRAPAATSQVPAGWPRTTDPALVFPSGGVSPLGRTTSPRCLRAPSARVSAVACVPAAAPARGSCGGTRSAPPDCALAAARGPHGGAHGLAAALLVPDGLWRGEPWRRRPAAHPTSPSRPRSVPRACARPSRGIRSLWVYWGPQVGDEARISNFFSASTHPTSL